MADIIIAAVDLMLFGRPNIKSSKGRNMDMVKKRKSGFVWRVERNPRSCSACRRVVSIAKKIS